MQLLTLVEYARSNVLRIPLTKQTQVNSSSFKLLASHSKDKPVGLCTLSALRAAIKNGRTTWVKGCAAPCFDSSQSGPHQMRCLFTAIELPYLDLNLSYLLTAYIFIRFFCTKCFKFLFWMFSKISNVKNGIFHKCNLRFIQGKKQS